MTALLLIAHGSRKDAANAEIVALAKRIARLGARDFERVEAAFLELVEPGIEQGIGNLAAAGASRIVVLPYFLAEGNHVARDIPEVLEDMRHRFPDLDLRLAPYIGQADAMADLALVCARPQAGA